MPPNDCSICCEKMNLSTRKEVCCVYCEFIVCRTCFQKYTLETSLDPHCMSCKKNFTYDFMVSNCTNVFITKNMKIHRENILLDREKALLPETQPYVVLEHHRRDLKKDVDILNEKIWELKRQERELNIQINVLHGNMNRLTIDNIGELTVTPEERKKFVRKCPMTDCRGFLSTQWKCGSCENKICKLCNEHKLENHVCNPEHVATMTFLNKDTKPCPNCGTMIHKISGCSQIFCTDCHTAWDWNTSRIVTGAIHNPHYFEFIQRNGGTVGRTHGDIPCGGLPDIHEIRVMLSRLNIPNDNFFYNVYQCNVHIDRYELRHNIIVEDDVETNRGLRIKYLMNELSEEEFKITLQQSEKKRQKIIAFRNIYQMFVDVSSDIYRQMVVYKRNHDIYELKIFVDQNKIILENLVIYFNENLKKIGKIYNCVYPGITKKYSWANNLETGNRRET